MMKKKNLNNLNTQPTNLEMTQTFQLVKTQFTLLHAPLMLRIIILALITLHLKIPKGCRNLRQTNINTIAQIRGACLILTPPE